MRKLESYYREIFTEIFGEIEKSTKINYPKIKKKCPRCGGELLKADSEIFCSEMNCSYLLEVI